MALAPTPTAAPMNTAAPPVANVAKRKPSAESALSPSERSILSRLCFHSVALMSCFSIVPDHSGVPISCSMTGPISRWSRSSPTSPSASSIFPISASSSGWIFARASSGDRPANSAGPFPPPSTSANRAGDWAAACLM